MNYRILLFNTVTSFYQLVRIYNASVNWDILNCVWVYCLLNVTFNDISVIYMTAHRCQANWRSWTYGRNSTPLTFRRVLKRASPSTDTGPTFLRLLQKKTPSHFSHLLLRAWGYGGPIFILNPLSLHGGVYLKVSLFNIFI